MECVINRCEDRLWCFSKETISVDVSGLTSVDSRGGPGQSRHSHSAWAWLAQAAVGEPGSPTLPALANLCACSGSAPTLEQIYPIVYICSLASWKLQFIIKIDWLQCRENDRKETLLQFFIITIIYF